MSTKSNLTLGSVGTMLRWENESVRVWNLILEPGESSPWHQHTMDYVVVAMEADSLRVEFEDGTVEERVPKQGDVVFYPRHQVHRAINTGKVRYSNTIIELKD